MMASVGRTNNAGVLTKHLTACYCFGLEEDLGQ
jgi:hypothetical protein